MAAKKKPAKKAAAKKAASSDPRVIKTGKLTWFKKQSLRKEKADLNEKEIRKKGKKIVALSSASRPKKQSKTTELQELR